MHSLDPLPYTGITRIRFKGSKLRFISVRMNSPSVISNYCGL